MKRPETNEKWLGALWSTFPNNDFSEKSQKNGHHRHQKNGH